MDIEKLKQKLETNIVLIKFESLKSRRVYDREYTLCEKYMSIPKHIKNKTEINLYVMMWSFRSGKIYKLIQY